MQRIEDRPAPDTEAFDATEKKVKIREYEFTFDNDRIIGLPRHISYSVSREFSGMLASDYGLVVIGKKSVTVFDLADPAALEKNVSIKLPNEITAARITGSDLVIVTQSDVLVHRGSEGSCPGVHVKNKTHETKIVRLNLDSLAEEESISLVGSVIAQSVKDSYEFVLPDADAPEVKRRVVKVHSDGQFEDVPL